MKMFLLSFIFLFCSACTSTPKPTPDVIQAKTTTREAGKDEVFENAPDIGNQARTEKQKNFLAGQKAYESQTHSDVIKYLSPVVNGEPINEMNYFAASLLFDSLVKEKKYDVLCTQVKKSAEVLCGPKSEVMPDELEICKNIFDIQSSCSK